MKYKNVGDKPVPGIQQVFSSKDIPDLDDILDRFRLALSDPKMLNKQEATAAINQWAYEQVMSVIGEDEDHLPAVRVGSATWLAQIDARNEVRAEQRAKAAQKFNKVRADD